jgi:hypothetical protein
MNKRNLKVNQIVYVPGDYFDIDGEARWSEKVAKIDWKTHSLLGVVKSFVNKNNENYVNVLWLVDYRISCVLKKDLTIFPTNLRPVIGVVNNFNIDIAEYVIVQKRIKKIKKDIKIYGMDEREIRLSGSRVLIVNNYEPKKCCEIL